MTQESLLNNLESELEIQLQEILTTFQNLPDHTLTKNAAIGAWSIAECFEHLNTYSEFYLPKIKKGS